MKGEGEMVRRWKGVVGGKEEVSGGEGGKKEDEARVGSKTEGRDWKETEGCRRGGGQEGEGRGRC